MNWQTIEGSVTAPQGFLAGGVFCDIKRLGTGKGSNKGVKRDLALLVSETPATVAGTFTTNQVCAAPVKVCLERVRRGLARAVVINSGNANACTGRQGLRDAQAMTGITAAALAGRHISAEDVLVASTGRIGVRLPMENVAVEFRIGGRTARLGGMCKGAGMIQPGMSASGKRPALHATMLCFLTTDAALDAATLRTALDAAVARSFNRITVDGDMSTNDTVLLLANGKAGNAPPRAGSRDLAVFQEALDHVTLELAKKIVLDGEGVSRFVTVRVRGAKTGGEAEAAARAVANSALVKTSWCGGDPNWGRILCALGYSTATIEESRIDVGYSAPGGRKVLFSLKGGRPTATPFRSLCAITTAAAFDLHINLNLGGGEALMYAADLTEAYVDFNKGDVNDPSTLGG